MRWIDDWLNDRSQRILISGTESSCRPVAICVPWGSKSVLHIELQLDKSSLVSLLSSFNLLSNDFPDELPESCSTEKELGVLMENKLTMRQ